MARQALAAWALLSEAEGGRAEFLRAKVVTARFYCSQLLPQAGGLLAAGHRRSGGPGRALPRSVLTVGVIRPGHGRPISRAGADVLEFSYAAQPEPTKAENHGSEPPPDSPRPGPAGG
jgi:Acetyl-CoA dehydrogenase C-terminal like